MTFLFVVEELAVIFDVFEFLESFPFLNALNKLSLILINVLIVPYRNLSLPIEFAFLELPHLLHRP